MPPTRATSLVPSTWTGGATSLTTTLPYQHKYRRRHGGHIPGSLHHPREALIDEATGRFKTTEELRREVEPRLPDCPEGTRRRVIAYCNGGVASTSVLFTLSMLGYPNWANYDGS